MNEYFNENYRNFWITDFDKIISIHFKNNLIFEATNIRNNMNTELMKKTSKI